MIALHSAAISEDGVMLNIFLVDADGRLVNVDLPLAELLARAHVVDPEHHEAHERALDLAAEHQLRDAIRRRFGG